MQSASQRFGGDWTEKKLSALAKYLKAYLTVFRNQEWCVTMYIDAFAGTGYREAKRGDRPLSSSLFGDSYFVEDSEAVDYLDGSAAMALRLSPGFKEYHFIERDEGKYRELESLKEQYRDKNASIHCYRDEANMFIRNLCGRGKAYWGNHRAVLFLDPFGMDVEWITLEAIAKTEAIDTWILFPCSAVSRLLERSGDIPEGWANRLTLMFGTDEWRSAFYEKRGRTTLFGNNEETIRNAQPVAIGEFFIRRLSTIFPQYVPEPLPLYNSKNSPMFMFCFAAGNPGKGGGIAAKIARHILAD
jgi:three-Cys-motif partner protein